ncbi:MAG: hypothetical protein LBO20_01860 [Bifidobacteriaceae bacterium]|jgi:hypothetical protein|nr:hypothetical protein [Bifidobacteriaceae bacterium]
MERNVVSLFVDYAWGLSPGIDGRGPTTELELIESGATLPSALNGWPRPGKEVVVFADSSVPAPDLEHADHVFRTSGGIGLPGEVLVIEDQIAVETVALAEADFIAGDGPVYVAIDGDDDLDVLAEASRLFTAGGPPPRALSRRNVVFEAGGLLGNCTCDDGRRLTARGDGSLSTSVVGQTLAPGATLPQRADLTPCPWCVKGADRLGKDEFLAAAAAIIVRRTGQECDGAAVSGAQSFFDPDIQTHVARSRPRDGLVLVRRADGVIGFQATTCRLFSVAPDATTILEWYAWCEEEVAIENLAQKFASDTSTLRQALATVLRGIAAPATAHR